MRGRLPADRDARPDAARSLTMRASRQSRRSLTPHHTPFDPPSGLHRCFLSQEMMSQEMMSQEMMQFSRRAKHRRLARGRARSRPTASARSAATPCCLGRKYACDKAMRLEAPRGIEPRYTDLQSVA